MTKVMHPDIDVCKSDGKKTLDDVSNEYSNFERYKVYSPSEKFLEAMFIFY